MHNGREIIATLTSIPSRLDLVHHVIRNLLVQTVKPDRVVLSLPHESIREETEYVVTDDIQVLVNTGEIELLRCKDYGPATKLLGVLEHEMGKSKEEEPFIFFFDDDRLYHNNAIETMLSDGILDEEHAVCRMGNILYTEPYSQQRIVSYGVQDILEVDVFLGYGGVGVRPSFFDERVFTHEVEGSFFVDDIHLSGNLKRNGVSIFVPHSEPTHWQKFALEHGFQELDPALRTCHVNALEDINRENIDYTIDTLEHFKLPR